MAFGAWFAPSWCSQKEEKQGVAVLRLVVVLLLPGTAAALCKKKLKKRKNTTKNRSTKKCRKQRKAGKVQQVINGGGVQVGTCERPGRCQPSPVRKKMQVNKSMVCLLYTSPSPRD